MKTPVKKQKQHYVDNQEFLAAIIVYKKKLLSVAEQEIPGFLDLPHNKQVQALKKWDSPKKPRVNNYIGGCFLKIATHLSYRPNFINYMYKEDMMVLKIVFNILTILILKNPRIRLHTLHRLYTMHS